MFPLVDETSCVFTGNVSFKGYDFYISHKNANVKWITARDDCQWRGEHLTSIRSEDELKLLKKLAYACVL